MMVAQIIIGFIGLVLIAIPFSKAKKKIQIKSIALAIVFQIFLAFLLIEIPVINDIFFYFSLGVLRNYNWQQMLALVLFLVIYQWGLVRN